MYNFFVTMNDDSENQYCCATWEAMMRMVHMLESDCYVKSFFVRENDDRLNLKECRIPAKKEK